MFTPSKSAQAILKKYNATYRTHIVDGKPHAQAIDLTTGQLYMVPNPAPKPLPPEKGQKPKHWEPMIPLEVPGDDLADAVENLCERIPTADKPVTAAQAASIQAASGEISARDSEITKLRKQLAEAQRKIDSMAAGDDVDPEIEDAENNHGQDDAPPAVDEPAPAPKRRGRPPKNPTPAD